MGSNYIDWETFDEWDMLPRAIKQRDEEELAKMLTGYSEPSYRAEDEEQSVYDLAREHYEREQEIAHKHYWNATHEL